MAVSAKVHDEVGRRLDVGFEDFGERELKNIAVLVRVDRVRTTMRNGVQRLSIDEVAKPPIRNVLQPTLRATYR
jgi:adenylate cyclase